jgi:hypothetical protein
VDAPGSPHLLSSEKPEVSSGLMESRRGRLLSIPLAGLPPSPLAVPDLDASINASGVRDASLVEPSSRGCATLLRSHQPRCCGIKLLCGHFAGYLTVDVTEGREWAIRQDIPHRTLPAGFMV